MANSEVIIEDQTNIGRSDMTIQTKDTIYIFEFKIKGSAQSALQQIKDKKYAQKYAPSGKKIILAGVVIDTVERNIKEWVVKE